MSAPEPRSSAVKTTVIAAVVVVLTFIAGFVVGAVVDRYVMHHGGGRAPRTMAAHAMMSRLDRELDLTPAQRKQVEEIIRRHHERVEEIWTGVRPRVRTELDQANAEIAQILTPEQRQKFEKLKMRLGPHRDGGRRHREGRSRTESTR